MSALLAQVVTPPEGLSTGLFLPLFYGAVIYALLYVVSAVLENRDDPRAGTVSDVAFVLMALMGVYTVVLLITALAARFDLVVDMLRVLAVVMVFFAVLILVLFALGLLVGLVARLVRRDKRVTTT